MRQLAVCIDQQSVNKPKKSVIVWNETIKIDKSVLKQSNQMYFKSCTLIPQIGKLTLVQYQKTLLELQLLEVIRQYKICRGKFSIKNF